MVNTSRFPKKGIQSDKFREVPARIFYISFWSIQVGLVFSIITDSLVFNILANFCNATYFIINCVLFVLVHRLTITTKTGLGIMLISAIADLQITIIHIISLPSLNQLEGAFCSSIVIVLLANALGIGAFRNTGMVLSVVGLIDLIIIKARLNESEVLYFTVVLPMVIFTVSLCIYYFKGVLDKNIEFLKWAKLARPDLNLKTYRITEAEWRCLVYMQNEKSTKEMATLEKCSVEAIQARLGNIYKKLKVQGRSSLMFLVAQYNLIWDTD